MKIPVVFQSLKRNPFRSIVIATFLIFLFQNCGPTYINQKSMQSLSQFSVVDPILPAGPDSSTKIDPLFRAKYLSGAGYVSSCAIDFSDQVYCWTNSKLALLGQFPGAIEVFKGSGNICVLLSTGRVLCRENLQNGKPVIEPGSFTEVAGLTNVIHIYEAGSNYCAQTSDQKFYCGGIFKADQSTPIIEVPGVGVLKNIIPLGPTLVCGIDTDGNLACGGTNTDYQVIPGFSNLVDLKTTTTYQIRMSSLNTSGVIDFINLKGVTKTSVIMEKIASPFQGLSGFKMLDISGNGATCAVRDDNKIFCAGINSSFQVNNSNQTYFDKAVEVLTLPVRQIRSYGESTCILAMDYAVRCWGSSQHSGDDNLHYSTTGMSIPDLQNVIQIDTIGYDSRSGAPFLLKTDGNVYCSAHYDPQYVGQTLNDRSELCTSQAAVGFAPHQNLTGVKQISGGESGMCAVLNNGQVTCWGPKTTTAPNGYNGILGDRISSPLSPFGVVAGLNNIKQVSVFHDAACAITEDGQTLCWGKLGNRNLNGTPTMIPEMSNTKTMVKFDYGFCGLTNAGTVLCISSFGDGIPVTVPVTEVKQLGVYGYKVVALKNDGTTVEWSPSGNFQPYYVPVPITKFTNIQKLYSQNNNRTQDALCAVDGAGKNSCITAASVANGSGTPIDVFLNSNMNLDDVQFGPGFACRLGNGAGLCYGSRPFHSAKDFISVGIRR